MSGCAAKLIHSVISKYVNTIKKEGVTGDTRSYSKGIIALDK